MLICKTNISEVELFSCTCIDFFVWRPISSPLLQKTLFIKFSINRTAYRGIIVLQPHEKDLFSNLHPESRYGAPNQIKEAKQKTAGSGFHFLWSPWRTNLERVHQILHQEESSQLLNHSVDVRQTRVTVLMNQLRRDPDIFIQIHPVGRERGFSVRPETCSMNLASYYN